MNRPLLLRALPRRLRTSAFARLYRGRHAAWLPLYKAAPLRFAPHVSMRLVPGDVISDYIAFTGEYEPCLTRRVAQLARHGGTLVDVGANLGYFALLWAATKPSNRCVAFEASPRNVGILRENVVSNGLGAHVEVVPKAAGAAPGKLPFDVGPIEQTGWGGFAEQGREGTIEIEVVRVDEVIRSDEPIALLKLDIEGADTWALMGCERLLKGRLVGGDLVRGEQAADESTRHPTRSRPGLFAFG